MKIKFLILFITTLFAFTFISCTNDDDDEPTTTTGTGLFTATIAGESFSTNDVVLGAVSAGGVQAFSATGTDGKSFSSAIFPDQFPIGKATSIAYSSSISYKVGEVTYIPSSGTMTLTIMENYARMKGTFSGVFVSSGKTPLTISGEFDAKK